MRAERLTSGSQLRLAELLAALSVVTDLGIGRPPETAMRSCLLATGLAHKMGLDAASCSDVYYATLLRYIGCTAYAFEEAALWGGDTWEQRNVATRIDWRNPREALSFVVTVAGRGDPLLERLYEALTAYPRTVMAFRELALSHCEVGVDIARRLGMSPPVQQALDQIFERWDGKGEPRKLAGEQLSLPVRFAQVATQATAYAELGGFDGARDVVLQRAGGALDPSIAQAFAQSGQVLLADIAAADAWEAVVAAEPEPRVCIAPRELERAAHAFADMVDLQRPYARGHSRGVADLATAVAAAAKLDDPTRTTLRIAALFHDLGTLAVSSTIWTKQAALTAADWEQIRLHPYHTERILARCPALAPFARLAGMHHERQDGSGYYRQLAGSAIPFEVRLLAAADAYQAMTQARPYRPAFDGESAARELTGEGARGRLDPEAVRAVLTAAGHRAPARRAAWPAGLSDREVEVLRLIAQGQTYKDVARELTISPRTAAHHIQHIYNKIGVSTRAAAAMFAMEHDLLTR